MSSYYASSCFIAAAYRARAGQKFSAAALPGTFGFTAIRWYDLAVRMYSVNTLIE